MPRQIEEIVSEQVRRWELARQRRMAAGEAAESHVITITRTMGSGARIIAEKVAHDLGFSLWDRELVDAIAADAHVSRRLVEAFDERTVSDIDLLVHSVFGDYRPDDFIYPIHLAKIVAAISKLGKVIILGRGARFLLPDAFHVHVDASVTHRVQNMAHFENMSLKDAEEKYARLTKNENVFWCLSMALTGFETPGMIYASGWIGFDRRMPPGFWKRQSSSGST